MSENNSEQDCVGPVDDIDGGEKYDVLKEEVVEVIPFPKVPSFSLEISRNEDNNVDEEEDNDIRSEDNKSESVSGTGASSKSGSTTPTESSTRSPSRGTASTVEELYR